MYKILLKFVAEGERDKAGAEKILFAKCGEL